MNQLQHIEYELTARYALPGELRCIYLNQLASLTEPSISTKAKIIMVALQRELERLPADRCTEYLTGLLNHIGDMQATAARPMVDAIADAYPDAQIKKLASHVSSTLA